jgi:hypothetical protein
VSLPFGGRWSMGSKPDFPLDGGSLNSGRYDPAESGAVLTRGRFDYVILITYGLSDTSQRTSPK